MENGAPMDEELKLETDILTLDYLLCSAVKGVIDDRRAQRDSQQRLRQNGEDLFATFDVFMQLFQQNHPDAELSDDLRIKLQILTVTNLFCRRYRASVFMPSKETLQTQRQHNKERANAWLQQHKGCIILPENGAADGPTDRASRETIRRQMYSLMRVPYDENIPALDSAVTLLDILPEYMALCRMVSKTVQDGNWMDQPIFFMLHSALEQILIHGTTISHAANEAFAWGCPLDVESTQFEKADFIIEWEAFRDSVKESLFPDTQTTWESQLGELLDKKSPLTQFEDSILVWLEGVLRLQNTPILAQLEEGNLDGLTVEETEAFMDRVGIR
ncbi:hypothetical protein FQN52_006853 [Onygenales sp. PD_12]|nr:hypothetical protein FQN52_006853 [Onygenales sp. PD_12]